MSLLSLLVLLSLIGAVAFFFAGFLLRPARRPGVALNPPVDDARAQEIVDLREKQLATERDLEIARSAQASEVSARARAEAKLAEAVRDREHLKRDFDQLSVDAHAWAERTRVAEEAHRSVFEQEQAQAEAWGAQLKSAKEELKKGELAARAEAERLRVEVERLRPELARAREDVVRAQATSRSATEERDRLKTELAAVRAEIARLASESAALKAEQAQRSTDHETRNRAVEAALVQAREADERHAASEKAWNSKLDAALKASASREEQLAAEKQALSERLASTEASAQKERTEKGELMVRLRAVQEVLSREHDQEASAAEALRAAEVRLAKLEALDEENAELRARLAQAVEAPAAGPSRDDGARVALAAAQSKLAALERTLEENRQLREQAAELQQLASAVQERDRLAAEHKQLRLDAELMERRLRELGDDRTELISLRAQIAESTGLHEEVHYLRRREKDLEAQLYAVSGTTGDALSVPPSASSGQGPFPSMEASLESLVSSGGPRTAVLADAQGFLIAAAGESATQEGLAAFAAVAGEMVARARMLLPLADVHSVRVTDKNQMVLACHLFESGGEGLGVATLGASEPVADSATRAISALATVVGGGADQEPV